MAALPSLSTFLAVAAGGALGAVLRYGVGLLAPPVASGHVPWATVGINIFGSLALGALAGLAVNSGGPSPLPRAFLSIGVLGGFTTFSTFAVETITLAQAGQLGRAALYVTLSAGGAIAAAGLGFAVTRA